jgi:Uncharacterized protein conserved in bacteria C-term(DUF2220)
MLDHRQFLEKLAHSTGARVRSPIDAAWRTFQQMYPKIAVSSDARIRLMEILNQLVAESRIKLPVGKRGWDRTAKTAIPLWIEIFRKKKDEVLPRMDEIVWPPELQFAATMESRVHQETLLQIKDWLAAGGRKAHLVPLKERSAGIFGDEKRLDKLMKTELFGPGALTLELLHCYPIYPDLVWEKGNAEASAILIIENSNTYHSFCRWNLVSGRYAACIYGNGFMIHHTCKELSKILQATNPQAKIEYFGDLDAAGIRIPLHLSKLLKARVLPAESWYEVLVSHFEQADKKPVRMSPGSWTDIELSWFTGSLRPRIEQVFRAGYRLAQEFVGTDYLCTVFARMPEPLN